MSIVIYDRSAWKVNDKAWVNARKAQWKDVLKTLAMLHSKHKRDLPVIKQFFLTGDVSDNLLMEAYWKERDEVDVNLPFQHQTESIANLLELWLTEDTREENYKSIIKKYDDSHLKTSRFVFLQVLKVFPENGSIFSEREEIICRHLRPALCNREDYPNEAIYRSCASTNYGGLVLPIRQFLQSKKANPYNFARFCLTDWKNNIVPAWQKRNEAIEKTIKDLAKEASMVLNNPKRKDPLVLEVAQQILDLLEDTEFPEPLKKAISEGKSSQ
jgi:hypothetical protein